MATDLFSTIDFDVSNEIATITLNRPEKLNAFTPQMREDICQALDQSDADDNVKAVIFTGAGRAFCAGADLSSGSETFNYANSEQSLRDKLKVGEVYRDGGGVLTLRIFDSLKPVIGAINGPAVGIGMTMQLPMDIRLAAEGAKFGFVFGRRGITMEAASSWFISRAVGMQRAFEWIYSGRVFNAEEALEHGLVRSLHSNDDLLPAARSLAREFADNTAPVSAAVMRQMMWQMAGASHPMQAHQLDSRAIQARGKSNDVREGVASFLEKRPAEFSDRVSCDMPELPWPSRPPFE